MWEKKRGVDVDIKVRQYREMGFTGEDRDYSE
jgi:hypothetical protein